MAVEYKSSDIKTAKGLEHPRMHSGMYGFDIHNMQGQVQLVKELLDNSVDEATIAPNRMHDIDVCFSRRGKAYQVIVSDQGRGVPLDKIKASFSVLGTSGKWGNAYSASIGVYGIGAKATAALSRRFTAVSNRQDGTSCVTLHQGKVIHDAITPIKNKDRDTFGTIVMFEPDTSLLLNCDKFFDAEGGGYNSVIELLGFLAVFNSNARFRVWESSWVTDKEMEMSPMQIRETLLNAKKKLILETPIGITPVEYVTRYFDINSPTIWESGIFSKELDPLDEKDRMGYHIEFFMSKDFANRGTNLISAVNMTKIIDKTSVQNYGLMDAIKKFLLPFIDNTEMSAFFETVYRLPMNFIIMAKWHGATFIGQDKNRFTDREFLHAYSESLARAFETKGNSFWEELYELLSDDIDNKYQKYVNKDLRLGASLKNLAFGLRNPNAYVGCRSKDNNITELFITEGTSAGDWVKQICNKNFQAVFKLRGKPINPFKCDLKRLRANEVYQDLITVIGVSPADTDLSNCNFRTISLLTDADSDGYHIAALITGILYKINPLLLESGRVIIANPPLYVLQVRSSTLFARDKRAYQDAKVVMYSECIDLTLRTSNGVECLLTGEHFRDVCYLITHLGKLFVDVANKLVMDPMYLEMMVHCIDYLDVDRVDTASIEKALQLDKCRHLEMSDSMLLSVGGIDQIIPLRGLVNEIRQYILPEIRKCHWDSIEFKVTTKFTDYFQDSPVTLVQLYQLFEKMDGLFTVSRMKGLGEMNMKQLEYTCVDPTTRSFATITGTGKVDRIYEMLGVNTDARKELVSAQIGEIDEDI